MTHPYHHVVTDDHETLTVFPNDGGEPIVVSKDHPYFDAILAGAADETDAFDLRTLADLTVAVADRFDRLSERVAVANGRIYFDGDEVDNSLTSHMRRCLDAEVEDWRPLVAFMEAIATNPNDHSQSQLYDWLAARDFTIQDDGTFLAYKGVEGSAEEGYRSLNAGTATVNGEVKQGKIPNAVGDVIEMPRGDVQHAPEVGCSTGLHVGTFDYAQGYARGAMLLVSINPRDVVSVPNDGAGEKMRVCRYTVEEIIEAPQTAPVVYAPDEDDDPYDDLCACGDPECEFSYDDGY
jgi:hypothetical protein